MNVNDPDISRYVINKLECGMRMRAIRKSYSMSIRKLSDKLGISFALLGFYERGERRVPTDILRTVAELGGVSLDWLVTGEEHPAAVSTKEKYQSIFESYPIPFLEMDFSRIKIYLKSLNKKDSANLRKFLDSAPEVIGHLVAQIRVLDLNGLAVELFEAGNRDKLVAGFHQVFGHDLYRAFKEMIIDLYAGRRESRCECNARTLKGKPVYLRSKVVMPPGSSDHWTNVFMSCLDITADKESEKRLRLDHDLVTALLNAPMESVMLIDTRGTILAHNRCVAQRLGHPGDDLRSKNTFDLVPPEVGIGRRKVVQQVIVTGQPAIYEDVRGDRLMESHIYPVFDDEGKVVQLAVYGNDITDQERLKSDLEESEVKYRTIFEHSQDGINLAKWDSKTGKKVLVDMNQRYIEISGYTREELLSGNVYDKQTTHLTPKQLEEIEHDWIEGKSSVTGEFSWKRPDGKENDIEFSAIPITIGNETYILGIDRDITERKKMETALQESEKRFRELVESLPVMVIETDDEWHIKFANTIAYPSMGLSKSDIKKGYSFLNLVAPKERAKLEKHLQKLEKQAESDKFTYKALRKDGSEFSVLAYGKGVTSKKKKLEGMRFVLIELGRESLS